MPRGRPQKSNPADILQIAMSNFWTAGYSEISLNDLSKLTGMAKPGFYANFGNKEELFIKALQNYSETIAEPMLADLVQSPAPIADSFRALFIGIASTVTCADLPNGCFISASFLDAHQLPEKPRDFSQSLIDRQSLVFRQCLEAALERGELARDLNVEALAHFLTGQALAITGMARAGADMTRLTSFIDLAVSVLDEKGSVAASGAATRL